jgi:hypothetical protein
MKKGWNPAPIIAIAYIIVSLLYIYFCLHASNEEMALFSLGSLMVYFTTEILIIRDVKKPL